jgi:riboflavin kinase/FMN adenylyltransferase
MQIIRHTQGAPESARGAVLCLGNFDGFHRGHQAVFLTAHRIATERGAPLGALTTEPHPRQFFASSSPPFRLTSFRTKAHLFEAFGLDILVALAFDAELAATSATGFVRNILVRDLGVSHIVVGYDYRFGHGREGTSDLLLDEGRRAGFGLTVVPAAKDGATVISSTAIRENLAVGRVIEAARLLGHWWAVDGIVSAGRRLGRTLGFPTANLALADYTQPAHAIYAVRVIVEGDETVHDAVASFGTRPTVEGGGAPLLEVFFLNGIHDLYDRHLTVEFVEYLRPEERFESLDALKAQIAADCARARAVLADPLYARQRFLPVRRPPLR